MIAALALARLETRIGLVDHVNATLAPNDAAVLVTLLQRLEGINDLHAGHAFYGVFRGRGTYGQLMPMSMLLR